MEHILEDVGRFDFFDSFEARGVKRLRRGELKPPVATESTVCLEYIGLDHVVRTTNIQSDPAMVRFDDNCMHFDVSLDVGERMPISLLLHLNQTAEKDVDVPPVPAPRINHDPKAPWFLAEEEAANRLEAALAAVIEEGRSLTYDMKPARDDPTAVGTSQVADAVIEKLAQTA